MGKQRPVIVAIGGSDSAGMAGIQMDQRVIQAMGCHAATVISANTAQNSREVIAVNPVADSVFVDQLEACRELAPVAIKIGLLATPDQVRRCAEFIAAMEVPVVLDPVIASSSGARFAGGEVVAAMMARLLPRATLVTPNLHEAGVLGQRPIAGFEDLVSVATGFRDQGGTAVVIKGGHSPLAQCSDYCATGARGFWLVSERFPTVNTRGTGCAFASAAASALALGYGLDDAVVIAKMAINQGLRQGYGCAGGPGPVQVTGFPGEGCDVPVLADGPVTGPLLRFPSCGPEPLGLYPVVDRSQWLERLLPLGVSTIQLRIKEMPEAALREEIRRAVAVSRRYDVRLFINDHWRLALEYGAYGVHLGQEDLETANLDAIRNAGLRLGVSTHCHYEVARAVAVKPSYLACGPVYATTTKEMPWTPHGLEGLSYWRSTLADYPLVAIGGINGERLPGVAATGVDGVAMVTAITRAADPESEVQRFRAIISSADRYLSPVQVTR